MSDGFRPSLTQAVKVYVGDLRLGMYVCELDRPWLETDFLLQGFPIQTEAELQALQRTCQYVFVDPERTAADVRPQLFARKARRTTTNEYAFRLERLAWPDDQVSFSDELQRAREVYGDSRRYVIQALEDARLGNAIDTRQARQLVEQMADSLFRNHHALVWLTHLKARDEYTLTHCINVSILALSFGRFIGLPEPTLIELGLGALLHDLGKMQVPPEILNKPGKLTAEEFAIMQRHAEFGHALLSKYNPGLPAAVLDIVLHHHERFEGQGYPDGLQGDAIPVLTRITSIVDVYDAITSDRVYHDGMTPHEALGNLYRWARGNYDVSMVEAFIRCLGIYPVGSLVELNTGEVAVVTTFREAHRLKPTVLLLLDANKRPYPRRTLLNLASAQWQKEGNPPEIVRVLEQQAYGINLPAIIEQESLR